MRHVWLSRKGTERLLVFFAGWGMDAHPFDYLSAEATDVLMLYDYRDTRCPPALHEATEGYSDCVLLAWSLGVAVANLSCLPIAGRFEWCTALNGTVRPVHAEEGIDPVIFDGTIEHLNAGGLARFIRRACVSPEIHERYMRSTAQRSLSEIREELRRLRDIEVMDHCIFDYALIGEKDRIFPPGNQRECWTRRGISWLELAAPHFPFYQWESWEEVIDACRGD